MKPTLITSFSGGRTSGYMAKWCLDNLADKYTLIFIFMNTGAEDHRTLDFVNKCDIEFGLNLIWIEADIHMEKGTGTTYKIVSFETACRNNEPFLEMVEAFGVPNQSYPHCNRELKLAPFNKWLADHAPGAYRAIGIRVDEIDRMAANMDEMNIIYPLIKWIPTRKSDVLSWWSKQSFDLDLPEHYGNCVTCWKKSERKLLTIANDDPSLFEPFKRMELIAKTMGSNAEDNKGNFFRKNTNSIEIVDLSEKSFKRFRDKYFETHNNDSNGCGEVCDIGESYDMLLN